MKDKPVLTIAHIKNPMLFSEFEPLVDGLLVTFGVQSKAIFEVLSGEFEPSGLLPVQFPKDMLTVERQDEDVPFDMDCYIDTEGNEYDFGFGLNWSGIINDSRTVRYGRSREGLINEGM